MMSILSYVVMSYFLVGCLMSFFITWGVWSAKRKYGHKWKRIDNLIAVVMIFIWLPFLVRVFSGVVKEVKSR